MTGRPKFRDSFHHGENIDLIDLITRIALIDVITTITTITTVENIDLISEITRIASIDTVGSLPDITPRGSEGLAFEQIAVPAGAWQSPTAVEDPDAGWTDDAKAYDEDTDTYAYTANAPEEWSPYIILTRAAVTSDKIRFNARWAWATHGYGINIDIDVYKDGVWTDVYEGNAYSDNEWIEKSFSQGSVTKARVRFYFGFNETQDAYLYELDFWEQTVTGGQLVVIAEGQYLEAAPTLVDEDLHYLRLTSSGELIVYVEHIERTPHYVTLPHGINTDVWTPASGASMHVTSILVSVESAGLVEIFHDATLFMKMHFNEKKAVPIGIGGDLTFAADVVLKATFTADNATDAAYITAVGHEH